ncbi:uncharacterized protein prr36a [Polymixia lowei]
MKPDGVAMETMEPTEAGVAGADPSMSQRAASQEEVMEQAPQVPLQPEETASAAAPPAAQEDNSKPTTTTTTTTTTTAAAVSKAKPKAALSKMRPGATTGAAKTAGASGPNSRPGAAPNRAVNGVKPSNNIPAGRQTTTTIKKTTTTTASATGAGPKKPAGVAAALSSVRTQTKITDKKPVGPARTTSAAVAAATVTNGTKPARAGGTPKRPPAGPVNGARPKTTVPATRPATSASLRPGTSTAAKADRTTVPKTTRPAAGPSSSRPASSTTTARPTTTGTIKPSTIGTTKPSASRVTTAPSAGRTATAQPPKTGTATAKKDVSRPASAMVARKPTTTSTATKKPEPSKPAGTSRPDPASKGPAPTKTADPKQPRPKTQEPSKPAQTKKALAPSARLPPNLKPLLGRTPPASPANKPLTSHTAQAKRVSKPTNTVPPFSATKKLNSTTAAEAPIAAVASAAAAVAVVAAAVAAATVEQTEVPAVTPAEAEGALPEAPSPAASTPEEIRPPEQDTSAEMVFQGAALSNAAAHSPPQSPVRTDIPTSSSRGLVESTAPPEMAQEQISTRVDPDLLIPDQASSTSQPSPPASPATPQAVAPTNLNEEDDEEEREGSQQVSLSEMSGTTQPTEESRPGSAGLVGGSAWRAGGALFSELDSEEVSGSQQGASELSAPGVLEGTESMDDLGDASLKGAIDMEGASAGSPDFEKVPDIPANDFEEDEDDEDYEDDHVCDMDVGSERADDPQRPRHDNEVDEEEEDEDVEMASEGVTESGLESYGNADEDDLAEDERLDNLNRVAQPPPPPPPLLPSAPDAQWDQAYAFADPWAQPLQPQQPLEHASQPFQASAVAPVPASPTTDPWQADSETPTQSPAQAWLELGSAPFVPHSQDVSHHSSVQDEPPKPEAQTCMQTASCSAPGMSLSSTLSSESSTPEELCDYNRDGKPQLHDQVAQAPVFSLQTDPEDQDLGIHLERGDREREEEAEAETLPADEVLGGPATAPASNPSSSSTTEDEASDTEGEAQLDDPAQGIVNVAFDNQPPSQRCLSALEEGEEANPEEDIEGGMGEDTTPPSATSAASYGFDTMTTASNSNAQSTGDSCTKSPGIFSLEELPEEDKEPRLIQEPPTQSLAAQSYPAEQHYMQCGMQEAGLAGVEVSGSREALDPSPAALTSAREPEDDPDDPQPPYYSAICEKTENSFAGNV